jgi:hypothetical protein
MPRTRCRQWKQGEIMGGNEQDLAGVLAVWPDCGARIGFNGAIFWRDGLKYCAHKPRGRRGWRVDVSVSVLQAGHEAKVVGEAVSVSLEAAVDAARAQFEAARTAIIAALSPQQP